MAAAGNGTGRRLRSTVVRVPINAGEVAVTVTPGSTAPCGSVTTPVRVPCPICADAELPSKVKTSASADRMRVMAISPDEEGKPNAAIRRKVAARGDATVVVLRM